MAGLFQRRGLSDRLPVSSQLFLPQWASPPKRGTKELIEAYRTAPWLRAVTHRIASGVAGTCWRLYVRSGRSARGVRDYDHASDFATRDRGLSAGDRAARVARRRALQSTGQLREVTDHPLLDLLAAPNQDMTGLAALSLLQAHLDIKGETFLALERNGEGMPIGFYPLPPHWVTDIPTRSDASYRLQIGTSVGRVPASDMVYLRHLDPSNPFGRGTGVAEALGDELETDEYASKTIKEWFYNKAIPSLLVSVKNASSAKELSTLRESWEQRFGAVGNGSRAMFAGGDLSVTRLDTSWKDQAYVDLRRNQRDFIRQVFSVPPEVMGVIENSNRATIQAAFYLFAQGVLVPRLEFLRTEFQHRLVPLFDDRLCLEYDSPVPEDREDQLAVAQIMPAAFELNEYRAWAGMEPRPEFEGVFPPLAMPGQSLTSGADGEPAEPAESPSDDQGEEGSAATPEKSLRDPAWAADLATLAKVSK